jgi:phosphonate transport system substrate-binding protein
MKFSSPAKILLLMLLSGLLLALAACDSEEETPTPDPTESATVTPTEEAAQPAGRAIVLGDISDDPAEVIEGAQPLADYLAANLSEFGITEGQVRVAADDAEMIALLESGEVDLYFDSLYPITLISDSIGATPFIRRWRFGVEEYYSVIFTTQSSGITSLEQLKGQLIAFDNQFSTSGFVLPAVYLIGEGYTLAGKADYDQTASAEEIGFVFSFDDENTLQWVLNGLVAAGATDDFNFEQGFPEEAREQLVALGQTDSVPRQVGLARPGLEADLLEAIKAVLIAADESPEGQAVLENYQTSQFDDFPEGIEAAQEEMRAIMDTVQAIPLAAE